MAIKINGVTVIPNITGDLVSGNTVLGADTLSAISTGTNNIAIGQGAGNSITTGSNNIIVGDYAGTTSLSDTVVFSAGTTERLKVDASGLYVNGAVFTGGAVNNVFWENDQNISTDYTITAGKNAGTFGPVTIDVGTEITIPVGSVWSIV
jgi:hypothetical protein